MKRKIIVCLDGSKHSEKALSQAIQIAKKFDSKIILVHAVEPTAVFSAMQNPAVPYWGSISAHLLQSSLNKEQKEGNKILTKNSLPVKTRAKMAQAIVSSDFRKEVELISVGSSGAELGITIGIDEKFGDKHDDAKEFYYEKYKKMIQFDVPIWIEFTTPITFARG